MAGQDGTKPAKHQPPVDRQQEGPPPLYYRVHAALSCWLLSFLMAVLLGCFLLIIACMGLPAHDLLLHLQMAADDGGWLNRLYLWLQLKRKPLPPFKPPPITGTRCRKKAHFHWMMTMFKYRDRGKLLSASLQRHLKRHNMAVQEYRRERAIHRAVTLDRGPSFKILRPVLLLAATSLLSCTLATSAGLAGLHQMTDNLAAWELSQLAGWRFLRSRGLQQLQSLIVPIFKQQRTGSIRCKCPRCPSCSRHWSGPRW